MKPKILLFDIETAPATVYVWSLFPDRIPLSQLITPSRTICWGAKWFQKPGYMYSDEREGRKEMLEGIHKLLVEADAVVTYNGDKFDLPKLNGEFIAASLPPLPLVTSIDLIKTTRKMGLMSARFEFVAPLLKIGAKVKHAGFGLWKGVMAGDELAWTQMKRYNLGDVRLLERAYKLLRPHIKNHPYLGPAMAGSGKKEVRFDCPYCGSNRTQFRGYRRTKKFMIHRFECQSCGGWSSGTKQKIKGAKQ